jgi:hypothetical protein
MWVFICGDVVMRQRNIFCLYVVSGVVRRADWVVHLLAHYIQWIIKMHGETGKKVLGLYLGWKWGWGREGCTKTHWINLSHRFWKKRVRITFCCIKTEHILILALKSRRGFLERNFPRNFIGRCSLVAWPPRSPDLTPPVWLWRYLRDAVYRSTSSRRHKLPRLQLHTHTHTHQLTDVLTEREYRHDVCRADDGVWVSVCNLLGVDHKSSIVLTADLTKYLLVLEPFPRSSASQEISRILG